MNPKKTDTFQYPSDIILERNPLIEAWLEIRWKLADSKFPDFKTDPHFPFALGIFYNQVKDMFGYRQELAASQAPEMLLPHLPQHQFRPSEGGWPLLQLGPGVATVNFTKPYSWHDFKEKALYLREKLIEAYKDSNFETEALILRYRNGYPFKYSENDLFDFLKKKFNISLSLPDGIPGHVSAKPNPTNSKIVLKYLLEKPQGSGQIQIGTGLKNDVDENGRLTSQHEIVLWEIELASLDHLAVDIKETDKFVEWLDSAHSVIHEWFFSIVDGELLKEFSKGE